MSNENGGLILSLGALICGFLAHLYLLLYDEFTQYSIMCGAAYRTYSDAITLLMIIALIGVIWFGVVRPIIRIIRERKNDQ